MKNPGLLLDEMRAKAPLVQNISNFVSMNVMANVLLAAGASPAMVHAAEEAAEFIKTADALTINIGTLSPEWVRSMEATAISAHENGKPWVFDPVAAGATAFRRETAARLLKLRPTVVRGNASEILALAGAKSAARGADATDEVIAAEDAARELAHQFRGVAVVTGAIDFATDGERVVRVANGHPIMPKVTALGCSLTGVVAGFAAVSDDVLAGAAAALAYYGLAGERAASAPVGPGSFAVKFLDQLAHIDGAALNAGAKMSS